MEYVQKHTTENLFLMVLLVKSWWFVMVFVVDPIRIVSAGLSVHLYVLHWFVH